MKKTKLSQALIAATVVATLGFTAACSDSGSDGDSKGKDKANGSSKETGGADGGKESDAATEGAEGGAEGSGEGGGKGAPALTKEQLKKALVTPSDLPGYTLSGGDTGGGLGKPEKAPSECQVVGDVITGTTKPASKAGAGTTGMNAELSEMISVSLLAYEQADAEKILDDLRTASKKCEGFGSSDGTPVKIASLPDPKAGDEAVAFKVTSGTGSEAVTAPITVFRVGSTLATVFTMPMDGTAKAPTEVIDAQVKKLEAVK